MTDRHAGAAMAAITLVLLSYVLTAPWTFELMRDGTRIGAFPLAYLALCLAFSLWTAFGRKARTSLGDVNNPGLRGMAKLALFITLGLLLAFYHEALGFVLPAIICLVCFSLFMGQRGARGILFYSVSITMVLFGLFRLLDFPLTILPDPSRLGGLW